MLDYNLILKLPKFESAYKTPEYAGIYFFIMDGIIIYIGQAVNIRKRMGGHKHLIKITEPLIYCYQLEDERERHNLEKDLISSYNPEFNTTHKMHDKDSYFEQYIPELAQRGYNITYKKNGESGYYKIKLF